MTTIESRLAAVERQLRFHRLVIAGLLVALAALVGYGATEGVPDVIRAKAIDAGGGVLAVFGKNGQPINILGPGKGGHGSVSALSVDGTYIFYAGPMSDSTLKGEKGPRVERTGVELKLSDSAGPLIIGIEAEPKGTADVQMRTGTNEWGKLHP